MQTYTDASMMDESKALAALPISPSKGDSMSKDPANPENDTRRVFLDRLRRFVDLVELWIESQAAGEDPPHFPDSPSPYSYLTPLWRLMMLQIHGNVFRKKRPTHRKGFQQNTQF